MDHEKLMRLAIKKAKEGIDKGQQPFGACIVKNGQVISLAHNTVFATNDVTAHAEMNAIRDACQKLGSPDLTGCVIYATFKPCQMCQTASERANISKIYYGAGPEDLERPRTEYKIDITSHLLREENLALLEHARGSLSR